MQNIIFIMATLLAKPIRAEVDIAQCNNIYTSSPVLNKLMSHLSDARNICIENAYNEAEKKVEREVSELAPLRELAKAKMQKSAVPTQNGLVQCQRESSVQNAKALEAECKNNLAEYNRINDRIDKLKQWKSNIGAKVRNKSEAPKVTNEQIIPPCLSENEAKQMKAAAMINGRAFAYYIECGVNPPNN